MEDLLKILDLCNVLGLDPLRRIQDEVDESVRDIESWVTGDLRVESIHRLNSCVEGLCKIKLDRFTVIKKKALAILSYWDTLLMSFEKKHELISLVYYVQVQSENEMTEASVLSLEFVNKVELEYHKLREQINSLVLKKKSKLYQILKTTHLTSSFVDKDIADPLAAFLDIRKEISEAKDLASQRAETVAKIELFQHASEEIERYRNSEKAGVTQVKSLQKYIPAMLRNLEIELMRQAEPFIYDGEDAIQILKNIAKQIDATIAEAADMQVGNQIDATSAEEDMQVERAQVLQPLQVLPLQPAQVLQPPQVLPLFPLPQQFGFVPRAPRTRREPVEVVLPPAPPSPPSPAAPPSPPSLPDSNKSDDSMCKSDSDDRDYDPTEDL